VRLLPTFCSFILACALSYGQELRFQHITTDDGLTDNGVTCLYEDHAGYIWIGTERGLDRYDGTSLQRVPGVSTAVAAVLEDASGIFWIATKNNGLVRFSERTGELRNFSRADSAQSGIISNKLTALYDLNDTTLLIGSREVTLMFLDKRTLTFSAWTDSSSIAPRPRVPAHGRVNGWCHALVPLDKDHLWIGLLNSHLSLVADRRTGRVERYVVVDRSGFETETCAALIGGMLYAGGWQNGIDAVPLDQLPHGPPKDPCVTQVLALDDETTALLPWNDNELLIATRRMGLFRAQPGRRPSLCSVHDRSDPTSLSNDRVRCMLLDRQGTLWVGTANGLDFHAPSSWQVKEQEIFNAERVNGPDVLFHGLESRLDGRLRIFSSEGFFTEGTVGGALVQQPFEYDGMSLEPTVSAVDHQGRLLIGTEYGIAHEVRGRAAQALAPSSEMGPRFTLGTMYQVRGLAPDTLHGRSVFVVATLGYGVQIVDAGTGRILGTGMPRGKDRSISLNLVNSMVRTTSGRYWFASADGLFSWDHTDPLPESAANAMQDAGPTSEVLAQGEDVRRVVIVHDTLWAITQSGGLLRVVHDQLRRYVPSAALHVGMQGLASDAFGRLWITTNDGLLRFDPKDSSFIHVPVNDGRRFRKLSGALTMCADGRMAFCADNTLLTFRPEAFDRLPEMPVPRITDVSVAGKSLSVLKGQVELSYRANVVDIGVSALGHGFPTRVMIEYRMEGVESQWRSADVHQPVRYAAIPVGTHRFLLRVRDPYGRVGPERAILTISVNGPVWQRWWFYALIAGVISAAAYAWSRYKLQQALTLQGVRNRIASDLHDEVGSSLSSITIGSQLAGQLSSDENEQVKKLMARIGETSSQSLRSMSDIVWAIDPKNDQGEALVKRLQRIANELLESKGIDVSFSVSGGVEELKLPMNARKEIVLIFKEAAHNVSKYSGASCVQVSLHRRNGTLAMSVKDDGMGFDVALHPDGHGLGSMSRRAVALGSSLTLMSAPGLGTLVGVEVDLTKIRD
jgi:signal transduction histidine kinase